MELAQETKKSFSPRKKQMIIAICAAVAFVVAIGIFAIVAATATSGDAICNNVYVGTIDVGGMTEKEATDAIEEGVSKYIQGKKVTLISGDKTYDIYVDTLSPVPDSAALAKKAMEVGHSGNIISNFFAVQRLKSDKEVIPLTMALDEQALYSGIAYFGSSLMEDDGVISFDYDKNEVTIDTAKAENPVDTDKVIKSFKTSVNTGKFGDVELIFTDAPNAEDSAELLYNLIAREPVDAQMSYADGELEFTDEIDGVDIERAELVKAVKQGGIVTLPFTPVPAEISREELKQQAFSATLASYTTYFSTDHRGRTNNIKKAAEKINGHIMMPGDEFSYNGVLGRRTIESGFDYANAYSGNKIIQEVGGGICQISSTLYAAVLYSDLKVTRRYNHNLPVSYIPLGMDATVSYGGPDLCFVNNTDKPIMITASVNGGTAYVAIKGFEKDEAKKIEIHTYTIGTRAFEEEQIEDPSVTEPTVVQSGANGYTVDTYKVVYKNGKEESRKKLHTSTYQPTPKIVHVPVQPEEPAVEAAPEEQPTEETEVVDDSPVEVVVEEAQ